MGLIAQHVLGEGHPWRAQPSSVEHVLAGTTLDRTTPRRPAGLPARAGRARAPRALHCDQLCNGAAPLLRNNPSPPRPEGGQWPIAQILDQSTRAGKAALLRAFSHGVDSVRIRPPRPLPPHHLNP